MTDTLYYEIYEKLVYVIENRHELDEKLFLQIFEGKIKPIVFSSFSKLSVHFNSEDAEDICQDVFLLLWKKSIIGYFLNKKYEKSPVWFLSWCKIVVNNYLITKVRKKANHPTEELDNPEKPTVVSDVSHDPGKRVINREAVRLVYGCVVVMKAKLPMKLTWLCVYTLIYLGYVSDRIEATHKYLEAFYEKKLFEIFAFIDSSLEKTGWLTFTESEKQNISEELSKKHQGVAAGDLLLSDFIEKDKGLAKVSDWLYKINRRIVESLPQEVMEWNI